MNPKNFKSHVSGSFNLCFYDINLSGALIALAALRSGLKVAMIINQPLNWNFEPEIITLYPLHFRNIFQSISKIKFFEKISSLFPSLVYPQRILTVSKEIKFRSKTVYLIDLMLKREREIASLPVNFTKYPSYHLLENQFKNGLLAQEFRFDRNMAIIEILQKCKQIGAVIVKDDSNIQEKGDHKTKFICLPSQRNDYELKIEGFRLGFNNNLRIVNRNFEMTSQVCETSTIFNFSIKKKFNKDLFLKHVYTIFKSIGIETPDKYKEELSSVYDKLTSITRQELFDNYFINDPGIYDLNTLYRKSGKRISQVTGKKIQLQKRIKLLKSNHLNGSFFRQHQSECDEKFDLAKQTGIDYDKFSYYFYRYHDIIDHFIDSAYEQMNNDRVNPHRVWEKVEKEYIIQVEQEIFC
jgi:hypothetical protein